MSILPPEYLQGLWIVIYNRSLQTAYVDFCTGQPYLLEGWECSEPMYQSAAYTHMAQMLVEMTTPPDNGIAESE